MVNHGSQISAASVDRTQCLQMVEPKLTSVWRSPTIDFRWECLLEYLCLFNNIEVCALAIKRGVGVMLKSEIGPTEPVLPEPPQNSPYKKRQQAFVPDDYKK
ncbi:hypothetical protein BGZ60DRAFT_526641 [Tricladium varicosporioides]|nr:hypothetical protein BGZ60DRAFT_526641 [Hymenoscyphus varicosporioides]